MAEEMLTITTAQPLEAVIKQLEDALTQVGQTSITKKGAISLNPRAKYSGFLSTIDAIEGSVRQKREDQYDVVLGYSVKATMWCWTIGILGGLSAVLPALVFAVPFGIAKNKLRDDLRRALQQAQQELE